MSVVISVLLILVLFFILVINNSYASAVWFGQEIKDKKGFITTKLHSLLESIRILANFIFLSGVFTLASRILLNFNENTIWLVTELSEKLKSNEGQTNELFSLFNGFLSLEKGYLFLVLFITVIFAPIAFHYMLKKIFKIVIINAEHRYFKEKN